MILVVFTYFLLSNEAKHMYVTQNSASRTHQGTSTQGQETRAYWHLRCFPCVPLLQGTHSSDFCKHRLVLPWYELYTNGMIEYVLFFLSVFFYSTLCL